MEIITNINQLDFSRKYTYADYLTWQFKERVELLRGFVVKMSPAPSWRHQRVVNRINNALFNKISCEVIIAPFDVILSKKSIAETISTVVQPDICVVCDNSKLSERGCLGAPDLIVEVLSKGTSRKDLKDKKLLYEENGVIEYWVVHPYEGTLIQFVLKEKQYQLLEIFTIGDQVNSFVFPDFFLHLDSIFSSK